MIDRMSPSPRKLLSFTVALSSTLPLEALCSIGWSPKTVLSLGESVVVSILGRASFPYSSSVSPMPIEISNFLFGIRGPDRVNSSQNAAYDLRNRTSRAFAGDCSGDVSAELSCIVSIVFAGEVGSKGLTESKPPWVSEGSPTLIIVARLRSLRFLSLSSFPLGITSRDERDILLDTHLVSCETVLTRRIWVECTVLEGCVVEQEELELELIDALSSRR